MGDPLNRYLSILLIAVLLFVGLSALIGGIRKSPRPFFWLKSDQKAFLKTSNHYVLFGLITTGLAIFFLVRQLKAMGVL